MKTFTLYTALLLLAGFAAFNEVGSACAAVYTVTTVADSGPGSLRQAIIAANSTTAADTIRFNLPGMGVQTIAPLTPLPEITAPAAIDGYTQPGSQPNTLQTGSDARLLIRLDGINATNGFATALYLKTSGSSVRGLIIVRFAYGIQIDSGSRNVIAGNWIGLDADGIARGTSFDAIYVTCPVFGSATQNQIGGTSAADRNVICGSWRGISFFPQTASHNSVIGNYIGTDASGALPRGNIFDCVFVHGATNINIIGNVLAASTGAGGGGVELLEGSGAVIQYNLIGMGVTGQSLGNFAHGVSVQRSTNVLIGGTAGAGNRINCNGQHGIFATDSAKVTIQGNLVGTGSSGAEPLGNMQAGIFLQYCTTNLIGGAGGANTVMYNGGPGVVIQGGSGNRISRNSIYDNGGLGIDLGNDRISLNDPGDYDSGANELQNFPELYTAETTYGAVKVTGRLLSAADSPFTIEFFASSPWDPFWIPEGQVWLGAANITTDAIGNGQIDFTATAPDWLAAGDYLITATATDLAGNTSEFSSGISLARGPQNVWLSISRSGASTVVSWPASAGNAQLLATSSLEQPDWQPVTLGISQDGTNNRYAVPAGSQAQFFRLQL